MKWRAFLEKEPWRDSERLHIARMSDERMVVVQPFVIKEYKRGGLIEASSPVLESRPWGGLDGDVRGFLQAIVDLAWQEGIRPVGLEDNRNELKAVRDHLADMRMLVLTSQKRGEP